MSKELLEKKQIETVIKASGKNEEEAIQAIFKKQREEIYQHIDGYLVEMHVVSYMELSRNKKTKVKKFLGLFMPVEHVEIELEVKLKTEVTVLMKHKEEEK